jgi:hypothetical protein
MPSRKNRPPPSWAFEAYEDYTGHTMSLQNQNMEITDLDIDDILSLSHNVDTDTPEQEWKLHLFSKNTPIDITIVRDHLGNVTVNRDFGEFDNEKENKKPSKVSKKSKKGH